MIFFNFEKNKLEKEQIFTNFLFLKFKNSPKNLP